MTECRANFWLCTHTCPVHVYWRVLIYPACKIIAKMTCVIIENGGCNKVSVVLRKCNVLMTESFITGWPFLPKRKHLYARYCALHPASYIHRCTYYMSGNMRPGHTKKSPHEVRGVHSHFFGFIWHVCFSWSCWSRVPFFETLPDFMVCL
jgi:hypothetical protein